MAVLTTKLKSKKEVAKGTMEFLFEKLEGIEYHAGNSFDWTLINPPETDQEGDFRSFSSITAPYEEDLGFTTRMRDTAFKRVLKNMEPGTEIQLEGPFGTFQIHDEIESPAVFLAGGIGITPFYSMIKQATHEKSAHKLFLFYANHTPADAAYLKELMELQNQNPNFKLVAVMTKPEESEYVWHGETGHIDSTMLKRYLSDINTPIYYMAGPPAMVRTMRQMLLDAGIKDDNIKWEEFPGY